MLKNINNVVPEKSYLKASELKAIIFKENKNKSGIYKWTNKINNKSYVGSANCLSNRFKKYFSASYLKEILKRSKCIICNSLLKNGYENFQLEILEYIVFPSGIRKRKKEINYFGRLRREQYYLDTMKPEYNILKIAGYRG